MRTAMTGIMKGDDMHLHFRRGKIMQAVVGFTAKQFKRAVVMPNTDPPILTADDAVKYWNEIRSCCTGEFEPLMTIQITEATTPSMIIDAKKVGVVAGKIYPHGVTTNSHNGVSDFRKIARVLYTMQQENMLLLLHGESPDPNVFCLDREEKFLSTLQRISTGFPDLKIVLEHVTTSDAVCAVMELKNVSATITVHHLVLTLDDVVGNLIAPHNFCKPLAKRPEDREVLLQAATSGNPKFFYGGDSAPHLKKNKECSHGCAGVFNAPVALPLLAQIFEERNALDCLGYFVSRSGAKFYGLVPSCEPITLVKEDWVVPGEYDGIVPFMAGKTLHWKVAE